MSYTKLTPGAKAPAEVNAVIEIPKGGGAVKYELNHEIGFICVDRLRGPFMPYPENYGCIPGTLGEDGDPLDILVVCHESIVTGAVIPVRPVGVLRMRDEDGIDHKIIAVPADHLNPVNGIKIKTYMDLAETQRHALEFHFTHYKALESASGKFSETDGWGDLDEAHAVIRAAIEREEQHRKG